SAAMPNIILSFIILILYLVDAAKAAILCLFNGLGLTIK
ncbi:MAG: hypothetical protein ACI90A_001459, partial [Shewanella sp.]